MGIKYFQQITNYLRASVALKPSIDLKDIPYIKITEEEFENGSFSDKSICDMIEKFGDDYQKDKDNPIIIMPKVLNDVLTPESGEDIDHSIRRMPLGLLYIRATIDRKGKLKYNNKKEPWIAQDTLWPCNKNSFIFGAISDYQLDQAPIKMGERKACYSKEIKGVKSEERKEWDVYVKELKEWYHDVIGANWEDDTIENIYKGADANHKYAHIRKDEIIVILDDIVDATNNIDKLYRDITYIYKRGENDNIHFQLYENMLSGKDRDEGHPYNENDINSMKRHMGVMNGKYPLAASQRESIHHLCNLQNEGDVLAVSGPPGTGKTTLLQTVVADMMVRNAMDGKDAPIIIASSTNNQAVTNIIDSFGSVEIQGLIPELEGRWVDETKIKSFASYMPSDNAIKSLKDKGKGDKYICTNNKMEHDFAEIEGEDCIDKSKSIFLQKASKYFGQEGLSIKDYSVLLKIEISKWNQLKVIVLNEADKVLRTKGDNNTNIDIPWYIKLISIFYPNAKKQYKEKYSSRLEKERRIKQQDFYKLLKKVPAIEKVVSDFSKLKSVKDVNNCIDQTIRYLSFWLAVHYYEALWIDGQFKEEASEDAKFSTIEYKKALEARFKRMALLTPCMVMTFFRLPSTFYRGYSKEGNFLYNFADLLIVDEAGQVSPEIALASFSLAKRAVVVGDEEQIPPVWNRNDETDKQLAIAYGIIKDEDDFSKISRQNGNGINCSESSIMNVASKACRFSRYDNYGGLFLSEHRRCYNEIIKLCNDKLYYNNRLEPMRGSSHDTLDKIGEELKTPKGNERAAILLALQRLMINLPSMSYIDVKCPMKDDGSSHNNPGEAEEIAKWIANNKDLLIEAYCTYDEEKETINKKTIGDLVGIISPFRSQANEIKKALRSKGLKGISVGTIHTFQGAEYPIIILSTVYDKYKSNSFIDRSKSLVNVAVSRAKDFFMIVGNRDCLAKEKTGKPSSLLREYVNTEAPEIIS